MGLKEIMKNYAIDEKGNIYSTRRRGAIGGVMKNWLGGDGYLSVRLRVNDVSKVYKIHRLLAEAFISNPKNYPQINHVELDKEMVIAEDTIKSFGKKAWSGVWRWIKRKALLCYD